MLEQNITWTATLRVWWSLLWRTSLIVSAGLLVATCIVAFVLGFAGLPDEELTKFTAIIAILCAILSSVLPVRLVLGKRMGRYRLILIANDANNYRGSSQPPAGGDGKPAPQP
jgi:hypothetical protein